MYKITYDEHNPIAKTKSIIEGSNYRITILTSKLIRFEYSSQGKFENRQTKMVLNRDFETPEYTIYDTEGGLKVVTEDLIIQYDKKEFSPYGLSVELKQKSNHPYKGIWYYGDQVENLGGTARTLDFIDGATELEPGILSKHGISMLDDSKSPILKEDGWFEQRNSNDVDFYIFGYYRDYLEALDAFYKLTGPQPKLPRYALGNWWSRYYPYTETTYIDLMDQFEAKEIPFSVAVIDMDWHLTDIPEKYGSSWTGYTWDTELFPNPEKFITSLKNRNLAVTLNLHPSGGIKPFESMYQEMAEYLGVDWENEEYIDFNPHSEKFTQATFEYIYYPNEAFGVDFWWVDWQQGPQQIEHSIDPLWVLNHYHYGDNQKENNLGITFSRYSGPGSHRYPIGFSGDTVISWQSLDFQPYFTSTASNIGYGWWSHDIGGHRHGIHSDELMLRWLQFGVFSPINRIHSSDSKFLVKEPWNYREPYGRLMKDYLLLRHQFVPYIYTMNILAHEENSPLIQPMYYKYPQENHSYEVPNQYFFGNDLIVCPLTEKVNEESLQAHFKTWLPEGHWYDLQTGLKYSGDRMIDIYRPIEKMGLFFKEGSVFPLTNLEHYTNSIDNPKDLELIIGYGDSGLFNLLEDYTGKEIEEEGTQTNIVYSHDEGKITIHRAKGNLEAIPTERSWKINVYGVKIDKASVKAKDELFEVIGEYDETLNLTTLKLPRISVRDTIELSFDNVQIQDEKVIKLNKIMTFLYSAQTHNRDKEKLYDICRSDKSKELILSDLMSFSANPEVVNPILEIILA